jgi:hypothetical protein
MLSATAYPATLGIRKKNYGNAGDANFFTETLGYAKTFLRKRRIHKFFIMNMLPNHRPPTCDQGSGIPAFFEDVPETPSASMAHPKVSKSSVQRITILSGIRWDTQFVFTETLGYAKKIMERLGYTNFFYGNTKHATSKFTDTH